MIAPQVVREILGRVFPNPKKGRQFKILDIGCGMGLSTRAIASEVRQLDNTNATTIALTGIDASHERIAMAKTKDIDHATANLNECLEKSHPELITNYLRANAEKIPFRRKSFDLVFIMYVFHETPYRAREKILREAKRVLKPEGLLAVVDISRDYENASQSVVPSNETYLKEYQQNFKRQLSSLPGLSSLAEGIVVPQHVVLYASVKRARNRWWTRILFRFAKAFGICNAQDW